MAHIGRIPNAHKGNHLHRRAEHRGKSGAPANAHITQIVQRGEPRIDVRIFKRQEKTAPSQGDYYANFRLFSVANPNFAVQCDLELDRKPQRERDFEAGVVCGALAERINELYGDNFDVELSAHVGSRQLQKLVEAWEQGQ